MVKYLYYENGKEEILTETQLREYFNTNKGFAKQKEQGTTYETWLEEMLHMQILNLYAVEVPSRYRHEYVCCLPSSLESVIMKEVRKTISELRLSDAEKSVAIENANSSKVCDLTDTIEIVFVEDEEPIMESIIYKHGDDDYAIWQLDLPESAIREIESILDKYRHRGCSTRGRAKDLIAEYKRNAKK